MNPSGSSPFEETVQLSNEWLNELMEATGYSDRRQAYQLLRATFHALRDRLPAHEAVQFGAQMPMLLRGLFYDGWHMRDMPTRERSKHAFIAHVEEAAPQLPGDTETLVRHVFALLDRRMSRGAIESLKHVLPLELRQLWPSYGAEARAEA